MSASSFSCNNLTPYFCDPCGTLEKGGVRAVAYVLRDANILDPSNDQEWFDLICNNYALIIPNVRGSYDGGVITEAAGYGGAITRNDGRIHTLTYMHAWSCSNVEFYNSLARRSDMEVFWITKDQIFRSSEVVAVLPLAPIAEGVSSTIEFTVTVKWGSDELAYCFPKPRIIENCGTLARAQDCLTCNPVTLYPC